MALPEVPGVYEIAVEARFKGQQCVNRFHYYEETLGSPNYNTLHTAFINDVLVDILTIQSQNYVMRELRITPLFGTDLGLVGANIQTGGQSSPADLPPFMAWKFKLLHGDRRVRPGQKRFAGVTEGAVDDETYNSSLATAVSALSVSLAQTLTDGSLNFVPVIVHYPSDKYPSIILAQVVSAIFTGWTTQNSRKAGRGQ